MRDYELTRRIGNRMRKRRKALGMTQAELAGTELSKSFISQVGQGKVTPSVPALVLIAERLGCSLDYFVAEEPVNEFNLARWLNTVGVDPEKLAEWLTGLARALKASAK